MSVERPHIIEVASDRAVLVVQRDGEAQLYYRQREDEDEDSMCPVPFVILGAVMAALNQWKDGKPWPELEALVKRFEKGPLP